MSDVQFALSREQRDEISKATAANQLELTHSRRSRESLRALIPFWRCETRYVRSKTVVRPKAD
jgi:hypothetical protein